MIETLTQQISNEPRTNALKETNFNLKVNDCMQIATHSLAIEILRICPVTSLCENVRIVTNFLDNAISRNRISHVCISDSHM